MRVAAAVVGGIGALAGMLKGLLQIMFWLFLGLSANWNSYVTLVVCTEGAMTVFSILGMVGVGLAASGRRLGIGALLMLIGAVGIAVATTVYGATLPRLVPIDPSYASPVYYVISLSPTVALFAGACLAFLARSRSRS